jgi:hypothetical protein
MSTSMILVSLIFIDFDRIVETMRANITLEIQCTGILRAPIELEAIISADQYILLVPTSIPFWD